MPYCKWLITTFLPRNYWLWLPGYHIIKSCVPFSLIYLQLCLLKNQEYSLQNTFCLTKKLILNLRVPFKKTDIALSMWIYILDTIIFNIFPVNLKIYTDWHSCVTRKQRSFWGDEHLSYIYILAFLGEFCVREGYQYPVGKYRKKNSRTQSEDLDNGPG